MSEAIDFEKETISIADYLDGEPVSLERHEYANGQVFAMAGASEDHETVALNLSAALLMHSKGKGCRVFKGDMKLRLSLNETDLFYYPDIMVTCDPRDSDPIYKKHPKVLVEVMSDYNKDHVEKLFAYQQIETLEEYLIIDQDPAEQKAWLYRRESNWAKEEGAPDGLVTLSTLDFSVPLADLYEV
ncbi:MAG: Uma2 family endonuclease [Verrucomicrobiota bacterium]